MYKNIQPTQRSGAALIIVLVLLACLTMVAGAVLPQMLRDRYVARQELVRIQSRQLLDDALGNAKAKRQANPEFAGTEFSLGPDQQPFSGTFYVTTKFENDVFTATVEYHNKDGKIVYAINQPSLP